MSDGKIIYGIIFLPMICLLGFVTSLEDFLTSKIKNKWILAGLLYSLIIYLLSWILYSLALRKFLNPAVGYITSYLVWNFDRWCINLLISAIVAYLLWHFKMWGAGDAKLFICYASLIPMGQYSRLYFNYYFASLFLLLAIFIPATIFLFLNSIVYFIKRFDLDKIREETPKFMREKLTKFNKVNAGSVVLGFFVFFWFFKILREELTNLASRFLPNQNTLILFSLLVFKPLSKIFKKQAKHIIVAFVILAAYFVLTQKYSKQQFILEIGSTFSNVISIMILFPILRKIIDLYVEKTTQKTTPFAIWMFLGALLTWFWRG